MLRTSAERRLRIGAHLALGFMVLLVAVRISRPDLETFRLSAPTPGQAAYALAALGFLGTGLALIRRRLPQGNAWDEVRMVSLVALALWLFRPFLDPGFFGGVDARSYGYTMIDALQQARAGVFPVFAGQGEFMFNGAIHPFRTAPYHQYLGMLLDAATLRTLTPVAVQHLTVVVTAAQGGILCYACLVALAPARRGMAWFMTVLYLSAPAAAASIYGQEMYMTFMAYGWMPLVVFGNLQLIRSDRFSGWLFLVAGLALVWFCHPPVAAWLTLCTAGIQGMRLVARDFYPAAWARAFGGGLLLVGLTAGFFRSISEISMTGKSGVGGLLAGGLALAVAISALIRWLATGRWAWFGTTMAASAALWFVQREYGRWLLAALVPAIVFIAAAARDPAGRLRKRLPEWSVAILLAGGLLTLPWHPAAGAIPPLHWVLALFPKVLQPVSDHAQALTDVQLGYTLWVALIAGVVAAVLRPAWETRLLSLAGVLWLALLIPVPGVSRFLLSSLPEMFYSISSDSAWLRYIPTMTVLCTFLGFLAMEGWVSWRPAARRAGLAILAAALVWNLFEAEKFVRCGYRNINTPETIAAFYRTENARQFSYIFPRMPVSPYLTNGVVDYHLESRLLRADDPATEVADTLPWAQARRLTFTTRVDDASPYWFHLEPALTLAPGERLLLKFEFLNHAYNGTLIARGPGGFYREYPLPAAGFFAKSFGVDPSRPKTIALWNGTSAPQPVELLFLSSELPPGGAFGDFARVEVLSYDPDKLPIRTTSLIPYRAEVRAEASVWLETPRAFIPGYRATVNGVVSDVKLSPNSMAMVKLAAGENRVELRNVGTRALWAALILSGLTWCGVAAAALRGLWKAC